MSVVACCRINRRVGLLKQLEDVPAGQVVSLGYKEVRIEKEATLSLALPLF